MDRGMKSEFVLQVLFRFANSDLRYLHAVDRPRTSRSRSHEVNCAPQQFAWKLQVYDDATADPSSIRAGNPVLLYHKEIDAFLTANIQKSSDADMVCACVSAGGWMLLSFASAEA